MAAAKMRDPAREDEWIADMLRNIALIRSIAGPRSLDDFLVDDVAQKAVKMCLIEISEAAGRLTLDLQQRHPMLPWRAIEDLRNAYTHAYHDINPRLMWQTATVSLTALEAALMEEQEKQA